MKHKDKSKDQLVKESAEIRKQLAELQERKTKMIEEVLKENEQKYLTVLKQSNDNIFLMDEETRRILEANEALQNLLGYSAEEIKGLTIYDFVAHPPEDIDKRIEQILREKRSFLGERRYRRKDGSIVDVEVNIGLIVHRDKKVLCVVSRDISERKHAEETLRNSEEMYRALVRTSPEAIVVSDLEGRITAVSEYAYELYNCESSKDLLGKSSFELIAPEDQERAMMNLKKTLKHGVSRNIEYTLLKKDGTRYLAELNVALIKDTNEKPKAFISTIRDITESKKVGEALRESENKYKTLTENINVAIYRNTVEPKGRFIEANSAMIKMFGYKSKQEFLSINVADLYQDPEDRKKFNEKMLRDGYVKNEELKLKRKDGSPFTGSVSAVAVKDKNGDVEYYDGIIDDITERKRTEQIQLVLFNISNAVNTTTDLDELFEVIRKYLSTIVDTTNFYIAIYNEEDYTISLPYFVDEKDKFTVLPAGKTLTSYVIRSGKPLFARDDEIRKMAQDGKVELEIIGAPSKVWLGVPLVVGNEVIGALVVQSYTDPNLYDEKDLGILKFVSGQIGTAIERRLAQDELKKSLEKLLRTLEGTVNALASATEKRDPYTAGHQQRVTRLACAIAKEMKLSEEQIEGIRVAGILHDIGKIYVAAEILNKPIKLSDIEMSLVRTHAQVGYDILKTVEFVFPVAQVVLQHHERLNGSGYPQGFKGEEILLESKILGVSDVVEAMCSHRPYRPAHGTDKALAEIIEQRGILYDPAVVDTCVKLFREGKFKFE